jgi:hypothetical protein
MAKIPQLWSGTFPIDTRNWFTFCLSLNLCVVGFLH